MAQRRADAPRATCFTARATALRLARRSFERPRRTARATRRRPCRHGARPGGRASTRPLAARGRTGVARAPSPEQRSASAARADARRRSRRRPRRRRASACARRRGALAATPSRRPEAERDRPIARRGPLHRAWAAAASRELLARRRGACHCARPEVVGASARRRITLTTRTLFGAHLARPGPTRRRPRRAVVARRCDGSRRRECARTVATRGRPRRRRAAVVTRRVARRRGASAELGARERRGPRRP